MTLQGLGIRGLVLLVFVAVGVLLPVTESMNEPVTVIASDHDDGETDIKSRSLNLTDVYVFREDWQTGNAGDDGNLIIILNTGNRNVARQYYPFSTVARYNIHMDRLTANTDTAAGNEDIRFTFTFGAPDAANIQNVSVGMVLDGQSFSSSGTLQTTPIGTASTGADFTLGGVTMRLFAGLREDPFFFDVEQFFRVRAGAIPKPAGSPAVGFRPQGTAVDFTAGYNVNAIVLRVPILTLRNGTTDEVFDVWATVDFAQ